MLKHLSLVLALLLAMPAIAQSADASADGAAPYDLLFREGTLDEIPRDSAVVYHRAVTNSLMPAAATRDSGDIALRFPPGEEAMAEITLTQGDKSRGLGRFPASVGNPMIMFFYETVIRDMAESAGGSPFYIRNRVKEALVQPAEVIAGEAEYQGQMVPTRTVSLYPFREDPNRDQMKGFGDLELQVVMSEAVPGWYLSLIATAPGAEAPVYRSAITFDGLEGAQ